MLTRVLHTIVSTSSNHEPKGISLQSKPLSPFNFLNQAKWSPQGSNRIIINKTANIYSKQAHSAQNKNSTSSVELMMDPAGVEPATFCVQSRRSSQMS